MFILYWNIFILLLNIAVYSVSQTTDHFLLCVFYEILRNNLTLKSKLFQVNNGISTNLTENQWVDLGNLSAVACLPLPDSCGTAGGAMSVWIRILDCPDGTGIISSFDVMTGFHVFCINQNTRYSKTS